MKRGLTLVEVLIALLLAGLVVGFASAMLRDENSNMLHVRSRVQSQTAARDGMKILESELRASGFLVNVSYSDLPKLQISSVAQTCGANSTEPTTGSSIMAGDGLKGGNDTLDIGFPTRVDPSKGADCISLRWSRYVVENRKLIRYEAASRANLGTTNGLGKTIVGNNVDVFQVQLGATGISKSGKQLLKADSCCPGATNWTASGVTVTPNAAQFTDEIETTGKGAWSYKSNTTKKLSAGETWRVRITVADANASLRKDLLTNPSASFVQFGLYSTSGKVTVPLLSKPTAIDAVLGKVVEADLLIPATDDYRLGITGNASVNDGKITIKGLNALAVRLGKDSTWLKNPVQMNLEDWTRVKSVRVQILTFAPSDKKDYTNRFTDLGNYIQKPGAPVGEYNVTDTSIRALLDHVYPAGNNGKF